MIRRPPRSTLFPYTRSSDLGEIVWSGNRRVGRLVELPVEDSRVELSDPDIRRLRCAEESVREARGVVANDVRKVVARTPPLVRGRDAGRDAKAVEPDPALARVYPAVWQRAKPLRTIDVLRPLTVSKSQSAGLAVRHHRK